MESLSDRVRQFCSDHNLKLNKHLGQHFLIDQSILDQIIESAEIEETDHIVEIGPGIGILTAELLKKTGKVTAIELDKRMIPLLQEFTNRQPKPNNRLTIINQNALQTPFPDERYKIVANIPYHITSPLLRHAFMESERAPESLTLLIQREVAEKICDEKSAGLLTILVNLFGKPKIVTKVPQEAFLPPPKVDSAVLHIECFDKPLAEKPICEEIFKLTKIAFSQKRKMLRKTLGVFRFGAERLSALGIDEKRRPQELSTREWVDLATKWHEDDMNET
ncbi:MAG: 16S rRNA (adenine(1518)-N(6)/adenine(1519)-N(6))-dimethyltransferase RsmA [Candidatus Peribacteraceae bacterium]|jgi:16S rRNA (adenine1518-N6/adenine1519-N6)-dimethyltransferase|nr:16S rRNA (adenine(1518)-N(6)/adenine(1519)-N(6))-dimethyltransferase RsmA [Candidatus Peribacteraceae bacterium]MDP7454224.1 16S rRNA (adenine(1518)-N(6)/adenine(1519)-N(6))-dimethyltransferase RsmA [Candidatus Peribacteraceae bacterium]